MKTDYPEYLSKSSVGPSISQKRSPGKYGTYDPLSEYSNLSKSSWNSNDYSGLKKIPDQYKDLRQTFDIRTNNKVQEALSRANNYQPSKFGQNKYDTFSKSQYNFGTGSPNNIDLSSSAVYEKTYKKQTPISGFNKNTKSPIGQQKVDIDQKYKQYAQAVQKFKQQVQVTSKMSQQLKKLKQDRRKRLQAQTKEQQVLIKDYRQNQTFKKKKSAYEYYTPKQQKKDYLDIYKKQPSSPKLNLDKYKIYGETSKETTKTKSKYDEYLQSKTSSATSSAASNTKQISVSSIKKQLSLYNGQVGGFILGKQLGQGKFGTVYQGFHKKTASLYAIKKVPKDMIRSHLMIDQFLLQLKLQMFLNHQNILTLFHFFDDKTSIYLVLEYMQQGTLFTHLKKNKTLPEPEVATKIKQIASAIKYLHENQIAHRDIKPQNIVMSHGVCKLCDFGWATICDQRRKTYCGTFDYAPPQILAGAQYDYTVDLWCLGVLTYQLLVGKAPFYHISRKQTMKKILNVQKTVIEYPSTLSKNAVSFIQNLIKKDPKQRISSDLILQHPFLKYVTGAKLETSFRKSSF